MQWVFLPRPGSNYKCETMSLFLSHKYLGPFEVKCYYTHHHVELIQRAKQKRFLDLERDHIYIGLQEVVQQVDRQWQYTTYVHAEAVSKWQQACGLSKLLASSYDYSSADFDRPNLDMKKQHCKYFHCQKYNFLLYPQFLICNVNGSGA